MEATSLLVRDIMVRQPQWVKPTMTVADAARLMGERNIGAVVICRDTLEVEGIFTERDLLRLVAQGRSADSTPIAEVMTRQPALIGAGESWAAALELMSQRRVRHLPVIENGKLAGMLSIRDLMQHRTQQLEWLVQQRTADLELKNTALLQREQLMLHHLELAGKIQRQILPAAAPTLPPFSVNVAYHPLDRVSGDYYDFALLSQDRLGLLIADASGHGVPAAFVSVMAKTAFQAYGMGIESPGAVLGIMNERLSYLTEAEHFITMFYGVVDRRTLRLTYAAAGHPPPLLHRAQHDTIESLDTGGFMIGVLPDHCFEEQTIQLAAGDSLLLYTDGVIECRNPEKQLFGRARLEEVLRARKQTPTLDVIQHLSAELARFRGDQPFGDDVTCIALDVAAR